MTSFDLRNAFAPTGTLRVCINLGNPLLAQRCSENSGPAPVQGISVDIARALAAALDLTIDWRIVSKAAESVAAVRTGAADTGFFAIDPERGAGITFTPAYGDIEGAYLVRAQSELTQNDEVDRPGHRVVVGQGSAYDLFLTRHLQHATLIRSTNSQTVVDDFVASSYEVAAGVRQQLESDAARHADLRLLPGRFMVIAQAMGMAQDRDARAHAYLRTFIEEQKAQGAIARAIAAHQVLGVTVAAAA